MIKDTSSQDQQVSKDSFLTKLKKRPVTTLAALAALAVGITLAYPAVQTWRSTSLTIDASRLRIDDVERGQFVRDVSVQGRVVAANRPELFARESGRVALHVRPGDRVSIGDLLAEIDSPALFNEYRQEQSSLAQLESELLRQRLDIQMMKLDLEEEYALAEADLIAAKRALERAKTAIEARIIAEREYEEALDEKNKAATVFEHKEKGLATRLERLDLEMDILRHSFERQEFKVKELERKIEELKLFSPVDGIVGNLEIEQRAVVSKDQPIMTVVDMSQFEIEALTPEIYANDLMAGMKVEIDYSGEKYGGELSAVSPEVENSQVSTRIRFVDDPPKNIRQNQRVTTRIIFDIRDDILLVDTGPFMQGADRGYVYVIEDGVAVKTPVRLGEASVGRVEILSGLSVGDRVVISSSDGFRDHDRVLLNNLNDA